MKEITTTESTSESDIVSDLQRIQILLEYVTSKTTDEEFIDNIMHAMHFVNCAYDCIKREENANNE